MRKVPLVNDRIYHVLTRSIAKYKIFNLEEDYNRLVDAIRLYCYMDLPVKLSRYNQLSDELQDEIYKRLYREKHKYVEIIAYCVMPTHLHLLIKQLCNDGISRYIAKILDSYTRYFNIKHSRKGPLWEGKFKNIVVETNEQLLHLTRYIHLNPTSAGLVDKPEQWHSSSCKEYFIRKKSVYNITEYRGLIDLTPREYRKFVRDQISHQRELSVIKSLLIDNYSG